MRNFILFTLLHTIIALDYFAQNPVLVPEGGCLPIGISTNPDSYINPQDINSERKWDWRVQDYTVYLTNQTGTPGTPVTIVSPFYDQSGNVNTFDLANSNIKDYNSSDGWELLYKNFGSNSQGVISPFFMLYNRYTGNIRVFVNIVNSGDFTFTNAGLQLTLERPSTSSQILRQTSVLNQLGAYTFTSEDMQKNAKHFSPNAYTNSGVNNNYFWLYSDFQSLYDACTCGLEGNWFFTAGLVNNLKIEMASNGTLTTIVDATSTGSPNNNPTGFFGEVQEYLSFGSGIISGISGIVSSANKGTKDGNELLSNTNTFINNLGPIIGRNKAKNVASSVGRLLFELPKVNMFLNLASTLISTVKKVGNDYDKLTNDTPKSINSMGQSRSTESKISILTSGTIRVDAPYVDQILKIPGTKVPVGQGAIIHYNPIYDEVLGVWNLFEQPKFTLTTFKRPSIQVGITPEDCFIPSIEQNIYPSQPTNLNVNLFPDIQRLELTNTPQILLNPASGMKVVDVVYQIVYDNIDTSSNFASDIYKVKGNMLPGPFKYFEKINEEQFYLLSPTLDYTQQPDPWSLGLTYTTTVHRCYNFLRKEFYTAPANGRESYLESLGLQLDQLDKNKGWNESIISTPYMNQSCIESPEIFSFSTIKSPRLRVKVILEPIVSDPNSEIDELIMIHTFPGLVTNVTHPEQYKILGTVHLNTSESGFQLVSINMPSNVEYDIDGFSANSILENEQISESLKVRGDIVVLDNVTFGSGNILISATDNIYINKSIQQLAANSNVKFEAGKEIIVMPEAILNPEIILEINPILIQSCSEIEDFTPTPTAIRNFCNSSVYNEKSTPPSKSDDKFEQFELEYLPIFKDKVSDLKIDIFPNPATSSATIKLSREAYGSNVKVFDLMGRVSNVPIRQDGLQFLMDLSNLTTGVYLVKVSTVEGVTTRSLVVK